MILYRNVLRHINILESLLLSCLGFMVKEGISFAKSKAAVVMPQSDRTFTGLCENPIPIFGLATSMLLM